LVQSKSDGSRRHLRCLNMLAPRCTGVRIALFWLLLLKCDATQDTRTCFETRPGSADRSDISISVSLRTWLTHDVVSDITEIVLREFLGYTVTRDTGGATSNWGPDMFEGLFDVDMENWQADATSIPYGEYISGGHRAVLDAGPIGFAGKSGLYVFRELLQQEDLADYFKFFQNATYASEAGFRTFAESELPSLIPNDFPVCKAEEFAWCGTGQFEGYWAPPQCQEDPGSCLEIYTAVPSYDTSYFEQLVKNNGVKAIFAYFGWGMPDFVKAARGTNRVPVFYWYQPDPLLLSVDAVRISFPDHYYGCSRGNNRDANTGPVSCDYGETLMIKLARRRVLLEAPEAYFFISRFQIFQEQISSIMLSMEAAGGTIPNSFDAACQYVRANVESFRAFAPSCITSPPVIVQDGDEVFNPETMACESATVFGAEDPTYCFPDGQRPGIADRSDRKIKLARRNWLTHHMVSIVAEVVLRDYLGFEVELLLNDRSTSNWGPEMADGLYDIDMEQWQVSPGTPNYIQYVDTEQVLVLGPLGFPGRSGIFVARSVLERAPMADYYKFYLNGTRAASQANFVTFSESPLQEELGADFPICQSLAFSWCSTGSLEGYYAPPACQQNPADCVELQHIQPSWDSGYVEQLVKNQNLQVVIGYYGYSTSARLLTERYDHVTKSVPFYWWQPDAFIVQVDAVRISFPDYYYGCDSGNTRNPDTGTVACDFMETTILKIVTPKIRDEMQEAQYALERLQIFRSEIDELLAQHTAAGGTKGTTELMCEFVTSNAEKIKEWAPDCLVTPTPVEDVMVNDTVFSPQEMACLPVTCAHNEVLRFAALLRTFYCDPCPDGQVPDASQSMCNTCPGGQEPDESGRVCIECLPGSTKPNGTSFCELCPEGRYMETAGQEVCKFCGDMFYQNEKGQTSCIPCGDILSGSKSPYLGATSVTQCVCPQGSYRPLPPASACVQCPEGMDCKVGADMCNLPGSGCNTSQSDGESGEFPVAAEGFMTRVGAPLEVFECLEKAHCPGGPPGTCAKLRDSSEVACGTCVGDAYETDSKCEACGGVDVIPLFVAVLLGIGAIGVLTIVVNKNLLMQTNSTMMCVVLLGMMLTGLQTMGVFRQLEVEWFEPMESLFALVTLLSFDLKVLKVACVVGNNGVTGYLLRQLVAPCSLPFVLLILLIRRRFDGRTRVYAQMVNTVGSVFNVFFISIVLSALMPLVCFDHPGDSGRSVISQPAILCNFEERHLQLTIIGCCALLAVPIPFFALVAYGVHMYPKRMKHSFDDDFLQTYRFLFFRFTPQAYWFGSAIITRSLLTCLLPVVVTATGLQVIMMAALLCSFTILQQQIAPWRSYVANVIDGILNVLMVLILLCASLLSDMDASKTAVKTAGTVSFAFVCSILVIGLGYGIYKKLRPGHMYHSFICHHKADAGAQARFLKILLVNRLRKNVFIDSDDLIELDKLFDIVKTQVSNLVVYLTRQTLTRPWCAGEITTTYASRGKVKVLAVKTPSFLPPSEEQLQSMETFLDMTSCNLIEQGLPLEVVATALRWVCSKDTPSITPNWEIPGTRKFQQVASLICHSNPTDLAIKNLMPQDGSVILSCELGNDEALAASGILMKKIEAQVFGFVDGGIINLVDHEETVDVECKCCMAARAVIVFLSQGTLTSTRQVSHIVNIMSQENMASPQRPGVIPVNLRDFKFPSESYYTTTLAELWEDLNEASTKVKAFFKLISLPFSTNDSDATLDTQANAIERRIPRKFDVRRYSQGANSRISESSLTPLKDESSTQPNVLKPRMSVCSSGSTAARTEAKPDNKVDCTNASTQTDTTVQDANGWSQTRVTAAMEENPYIRFQMNL